MGAVSQKFFLDAWLKKYGLMSNSNSLRIMIFI